MAREALIELKCNSKGKDISYLLELLCKGGWSLSNKNNNIEYLPVGDNDNFDWQEEAISFGELKKIIETKEQKKELVGVHLFYKGSSHGISLLCRDLESVIISLDINRKKRGESNDSLTDFEWYFSNIILKLNQEESLSISYKFEDYMD